MAVRVIFFFLFLTVTSSNTLSQESVKRSIFEDCAQAQSEFSGLNLEEQSKLLDFLERVIALSTQSPSAPEVYAVPPGAQVSADSKGLSAPRHSDLIPAPLWQNMDARRELRAKRCALQMLEGAGALSLTVLPALVSTYSEQPLSDEIAVALEEVGAAIAEVAHVGGTLPTSQQIQDIVPHAFGHRPLLARNVLHEFRDSSLVYVLSFIATKQLEISADTLEYLKDIDPDGSLCMRAMISLVPGLSLEQLSHVTNALPLPSVSSLPSLIGELISLVPNSPSSPALLPLLGRACTAIGGLTIDASQQEALAATPDILTPGKLPIADTLCLVQSSAVLAKRVKDMAINGNADEQLHALSLCSDGLKSGSTETRAEVYAAVKRLALEVTSPGWQQALRVLASFPDRKNETFSIIQQLLKARSSESKPSADEIQEEAFKLLDAINPGNEVTKFSNSIIRSLRSVTPSAHALRLAKLSPSIASQLLPVALTIPPSKQTIMALELVTSQKTIPTKALPSLIELLRYPESRTFAKQGLVKLGKVAAPHLRKTIVRLPQDSTRQPLLEVLLALGNASKTEVVALATALANEGACSALIEPGHVLCQLSKFQDREPRLSEYLTPIFKQCVRHITSEQLELISQCNSELIFASTDVVTSMLERYEVHSDVLGHMADIAVREAVINPARTETLLVALLRHGPLAIKGKILEVAPLLREIPAKVLEALKALVPTTPDDSPMFISLAAALAPTAPSEFNWSDFVRGAKMGASRGSLDPQIAEVLATLPVELVLAEVLPALETDNSEELVGGALVGGALGSKAVPLVSRLWHLRTMRSPQVRYISTLALLEINPLTPDMHDAVRRLLVNRFFDIARVMSINWGNTVAVNDLKRGGFGTLRNNRLNQLLATPSR